MMGITTGGILNVMLDLVLILGFDMGISGAAIATIMSQFVMVVKEPKKMSLTSSGMPQEFLRNTF